MWYKLYADLSERIVLHIQAIAFDYYVRATFQCMRRTETSKAINVCRFIENNSSTRLAHNAGGLTRLLY